LAFLVDTDFCPNFTHDFKKKIYNQEPYTNIDRIREKLPEIKSIKDPALDQTLLGLLYRKKEIYLAKYSLKYLERRQKDLESSKEITEKRILWEGRINAAK
jgi:hypothetical protein